MPDTATTARDGRPGAPGTPARQADPGPTHRWWILAVIGLAQLMVVLDTTVVNIALPAAQEDLGFSNGDRQWIVTGYALAFGSLLLIGGRLADLIGRKATFLIGIVGFAAVSALGGAAQNFEVLVTARVLQGVFGALLAPAALALLTTTFTEGRERARAFGIYGAIAGSGGAVGLLLGGFLTEHLNWRWTLYVNLVIAVAAFAGGWVLLRGGRPAVRPRLDVLGTVLVTAGLFGVVYGFANAEHEDWGAPGTWGFLAAGVVLLVAFTVWETRSAHPLLPMRVLLDRNRGASFLAMLVASSAMFGLFLFLTYYLQATLGYTPVETGLAFLPMVGAIMITATLSTATLLPRFGPRPLVPLGMLVAALGMVWLTNLGLDSGYASHVLPPIVVAGLGIGLIMAPAMNMAVHGVAAQDAGVASAAVNAMQQVGGSIGTALLSTFAATAAEDYVAGRNPADPLVQAQAALHSYEAVYWWSAAFFAAGVLVSVLLYRGGAPKHDENAAPVIHL
jgi:EmrB/QacA subfamily drug resistance transporter